MIGAPNVDQHVSLFGFLIMVGHIGSEIGPTAIAFLNRPILIVTKLCGTKQRQRDRLPIGINLTLWRLHLAIINKPAFAQKRLGSFWLFLFLNNGFRRKNVMMYAQ